MIFKRKKAKIYIGVLLIILSCAFLLTEFYFYPPSGKILLSSSNDVTTLMALGGVITGIYLVAGPLPALFAMIPVVASGCSGCAGGGEKKEPSPDLGEPPPPPSTSNP